MQSVPYFKQQTPFTCSLACLRMVLAYLGRETNEVELAKVTDFSPEVGISMPDLAKACEIMNFEYKILKHASMEDIKNFISQKICPIVILKAKIYEKVSGEHGHFVIVKDIINRNVIINGPDRIYGRENKKVSIDTFREAWSSSKGWLLVVIGEVK